MINDDYESRLRNMINLIWECNQKWYGNNNKLVYCQSLKKLVET